MSKPLLVMDSARHESDAIAGWYDARESGVGRRFLSCLRTSLESISRSPESFELAERGYRRASVNDFPYSVYFREWDDVVVVHCVIHHARHPNTWRRLLP